MPRRRRNPALVRVAAVVIAVTASVAAPASATAAPWRAEAVPSSGAVTLRDLVLAPGGAGLLTWEHFPPKRTALAARAPAQPWSAATVTDLPGVTWGNAQLRTYGATRTILVAQQRHGTLGRFATYRLVTALGRTDGTFGPFQTLGEAADADARGDALVGWTRRDLGGVFVAQRPAGGRFGSARLLSRRTPASLAVAVGPRGDRVVAWVRDGAVFAAVRRPGHAWGAVQRVAAAQRVPNVGLAARVGPTGRVLLAWESADVREGRPVRLEARAALGTTTTGAWRATTLEAATVAEAGEGLTARPAFDSDGAPWVAWTGADAGATVVKAARLSGTAAPGDVTTLSPGQPGSILDDLAAGPRGALLAAWTTTDPTPTAGATTTTTSAATRSPAAGWTPPEVLTPGGAAAIFGARAAYDPSTGEPAVAAATIGADRAQRVLVLTGPPA